MNSDDKENGAKINVLGQKTFKFQDDAHHIVTFLNKTLKYRDLIFGLTQNDDETYRLTIYEAVDPKRQRANPCTDGEKEE